MKELRTACALVAQRARHVAIEHGAIAAYAVGLALEAADPDARSDAGDESPPGADPEQRATFWITLDAINFGSGWFPTLRKRHGHSGYNTIAAAWRERFAQQGAWTAAELSGIDARRVAEVLGQDPDHELMGLFAASLRDLGAQVGAGYDGSFLALAASSRSAVALARRLGGWPCFSDCSRYDELEVAFCKRAQIATADLDRAGVASFPDLDRLTMFADNLVPHVLRLDSVLRLDPRLVARIERGELIEHGSAEEVEIRACAVHAVELIVAAARCGSGRSAITAAEVDQLLWRRGQQPDYKASPRHRSRCTAY